MINCIWQSLCLDLVDINVYAKCYQNSLKGARDMVSFTVFRIWILVKLRPMTNGIWQSLWLDLVNINVYAKLKHNMPLSARDRAISAFRTRQSLDRWKSHFARPVLDLVNINVAAKFYQIFQTVLVLWAFSANGPGSKSSQTVRGRTLWL